MLALTWGLQVCYSIFIHTEFSVEVSMGQRIVPFGWAGSAYIHIVDNEGISRRKGGNGLWI